MSENGNTYDRRTAKTRKAIINALADLLFEKELHKVTVKEITEIAAGARAQKKKKKQKLLQKKKKRTCFG